MCSLDCEPRLETDRLVLRTPSSQDAVYIAELANDLDVARMTVGIRHPYRLVDAEAFLHHIRNSDPDWDQTLLIEHRQFGPIGVIGFQRHGLFPEVGYWLGRTYRNRGFATEAVQAALRWAQRDWRNGGWGKRAVLSSHFTDNPASARVLDKVGFLYTGDVERRFSVGRGQEAEARMMVRLA